MYVLYKENLNTFSGLLTALYVYMCFNLTDVVITDSDVLQRHTYQTVFVVMLVRSALKTRRSDDQ